MPVGRPDVIRTWGLSPGPGGSITVSQGERPVPALGDDDILVEVEGVVVGAPELRIALGLASRAAGGSATGFVVDAGASANHLVGHRVLLGPVIPCGDCDLCRRGLAAVCPDRRLLGDGAAIATHLVSRARWACALDGELPVPGPAAALLGREAATAYALYARAGVGPGAIAVVIGDSVVARFAVEVLVAKGARPIVVAGADEVWRRWIAERGAVVDRRGDPAAIRAGVEACARESGRGGAPWTILETTAGAAGRALALDLAGSGAVVALADRDAGGELDAAAAPAADADAAIAALAARNAALLGVAGAHPDLLPEVAALAVRGALDPAAAAEIIAPADIAAAAARAVVGRLRTIPVVRLSTDGV